MSEPPESPIPTSKQIQGMTLFYNFLYTSSKTRNSIAHFQLRNLIWATSKHDVYFTGPHEIKHWNSITKQTAIVADNEFFGIPKISSLVAKDGKLLGGGYFGDYLFYNLEHSEPVRVGNFTDDPYGITNQMDIDTIRSGTSVVIVSSNDHKTRLVDLATFKVLKSISLPWPVNVISFVVFINFKELKM